MSSPVQIGEIIASKYRVDALLGQGGMGVVVAATDTILDRHVAIKFLLPQFATNTAAAGRFLREARATARLNSEHAVRIIEVGELETGSPFMVMELLSGIDLGTFVERQGALDIRQAVDFVLQASRGLAEAHKAGIIHRDVKPSNLFLAEQATGKSLVKVLDFGVSKINLGMETAGALTTTGQTLGSPLYMSPEQMRSSHNADARSDIWGIGVVLFELLTGARPFTADSLTELVLVINQDPPQDPKVLRPDLPDALCRTVLRCLEKDPNKRFSKISELANDLAPFASRDSYSAIADIASVLDSNRMPGLSAPPLGQLQALAASAAVQPGLAQSGLAQSGLSQSGLSQSGTSSAGAPGALTSQPWATTGPKPLRVKRKNSGLGMVVSVVVGSGLLVAGGIGAFFVLSPTGSQENSEILSAASELTEHGNSSRTVSTQPSTQDAKHQITPGSPAAASAANPTDPNQAASNAARPDGEPSPQVAASHSGDNLESSAAPTPAKHRSAPRPRRAADEQQKPAARERLGF